MSNRNGTRWAKRSAPKLRARSLLKSAALGQCGAFLISACTSSNKLVPSYDAGLNDSEFEPRADETASSESSDGTASPEDGSEALDSADGTTTTEMDAGTGTDAGADAG